MSFSITQLQAAQMVSYNKGQETNQAQSSEKKEADRRLAMKLQQVREQQNQTKTAATKKGILA